MAGIEGEARNSAVPQGSEPWGPERKTVATRTTERVWRGCLRDTADSHGPGREGARE